MTTDVNHIIMDGKDIVTIDVRKGMSKPFYLREKGMRPEDVYVRVGPSSAQASDAQILRMVKESSTPFESLASFEQDLTSDAARKSSQKPVSISGGIRWQHRDSSPGNRIPIWHS